MPEEQQAQATTPAANDTKTSWNFGDFTKGLGSPLTKNEDGSYNVAGALLTGAGSGLVTWVLSRMLGVKSGPSLGISILAALAGTHGAFTKQGGLDFFSDPRNYLKNFMDNKREKGNASGGTGGSNNTLTDPSLDGGNTSEADYNAAMEQNMANENSANQQLNYLKDQEDIKSWSQEPIPETLINAPDEVLQQKMALGKNSKEAIQAARVLQQRVKDRALVGLTENLPDAANETIQVGNDQDAFVRQSIDNDNKQQRYKNWEASLDNADKQQRYKNWEKDLLNPKIGPEGFDYQNMTPRSGERTAMKKAIPQPTPIIRNPFDLSPEYIDAMAKRLNSPSITPQPAPQPKPIIRNPYDFSPEYIDAMAKRLNSPTSITPGPASASMPGAYSNTHLGGGAADNWDNQQLSNVPMPPAPISKQVSTGLPPIRFRRNMNPAYAIQSVLHPDDLQNALNNQQ